MVDTQQHVDYALHYPTDKDDLNIRDQWTQWHVNRAIKYSWNKIVEEHPDLVRNLTEEAPRPITSLLLPAAPKLTIPFPSSKAPPKICIVGAGAAGLFTALLIDHLTDKVPGFSLGYEIFEAAEKERVGGRLFTYNFPQDKSKEPLPHQYYDVGAMRFPDTPIMARTFHLFEYLGMKEVLTKDTKNPPLGSVIPYYMGGNNEPWCYNNINASGSYDAFATQAFGNDPFKLNWDPEALIDPKAMAMAAREAAGPSAVFDSTVETFIQLLKSDTVNGGNKGWEYLMKVDKMSTTMFLTVNPHDLPRPPESIYNPDPKDPTPPFNYNTIAWLETFCGGTNWYDQAHSETILEALDFNWPEKKKIDGKNVWRCVEGGAQQIAIKMAEKVRDQKAFHWKTRITGIDASDIKNVKVKCDGNVREGYAGVFNSTTLGCMQQMDLTQAGLNYGQRQAIRSLGYGASTKVGVRFKTAWWRKWYGIDKGGLGHSDLPIRTTVYPSYNVNDPVDQTSVLLVSYQWQQDAQRLGTLMSSSKDPKVAMAEEGVLKELLLRNLAQLHAQMTTSSKDAPTSEQEIYKEISKLYVDHYSHDWYHDENTFGAFAFFRPQQFSEMWPYIIQCTPNVVIIGEHASNHHAWVVGALESVVNGMYHWLWHNQGLVPEALAARRYLKKNKMGVGNPFTQLPSFTSDLQQDWQEVIGMVNEAIVRDNLEKRQDSAFTGPAGLR